MHAYTTHIYTHSVVIVINKVAIHFKIRLYRLALNGNGHVIKNEFIVIMIILYMFIRIHVYNIFGFITFITQH